MREVKLYLFQLILVVTACVSLAVLTTKDIKVNNEEYIEWNDADWTVINEDGVVLENTSLPSTVETNKGTVWIQKTLLPEECKPNMAMVFLTVHSKVDVLIDGELVYTTSADDVTYTKSRGHNWNCIDILPQYAGKKIYVYFEYPYSTSVFAIPTIYFGKEMDITSSYIQRQTPTFLTSLFTIILGLLLIIVYVFLGKDHRLERRLLWIGWFAMALGVWSLTETNFLILYMRNTLFIAQIAFLSLKLTFMPVVMFFKETFNAKHDKFIFGLCIFSMADVIITTLLQLFGIADFKESVWITHLYMFVGAIYFFISIMYYLWRDRNVRKKNSMRNTVNTVGIIVVTVCVFIDFVRYYAEIVRVDAARYSRIGLLFYILILGLGVIKDSLHLLDVEHEAERLKEEALLDPVTHLANRTSFDKDCSEISKEDRMKSGVIMCDLNGLKYFNDHYGHSMGDSYIFIAAELICDTFTAFGKTYRVGGDEFVVLTKDLNEDTFTEIYEKMNERIASLSKSCFDERMGIAAGFANFDPGLDTGLRDTEKRADEKMYIKKKQMKAENERFRRNEGGASEDEELVENPLLKKKQSEND